MEKSLLLIYEFAISSNMVNEIEINVRALRASLNMSQTQFAAVLGVSQTVVSNWETKGPPKRGAARKLLQNMALFGRQVFVRDHAA